jgi:hypothetical protein
MVWVGSFKSLQTMLFRPRLLNAPLEVHTWVPTSIALISRLVDWLMRLIAGSRRVEGTEHFVALALQVFESNYRLPPPRKIHEVHRQLQNRLWWTWVQTDVRTRLANFFFYH